MKQPSEAVFAKGNNARPLAIHPDAIGATYPTRVAKDVAEIVNGVAVLSVHGPLDHHGTSEWCWWQTYENLAIDFGALCDAGDVSAIVLKFDSPGGAVSGLNETVRIMQGMKAKAGKPVIGYVDESCYSAAYALAMVCDELYLPESGGVGSIGVITAMADVTKMNEKDGIRVEVIASGSKKTDGHPHVPITDGAISRTRKTIDGLAKSFFALVAAGRGLSAKTVEEFQAGIFTGQAAVDAGLADGVMSLSDCLTFATNEFSSSNRPTNRSADKEDALMSGTLAAAKALNDANKALAAAKTDGDRALAAARVLAAESAMVEAKKTKTKTVTTDTHEEEFDDGKDDEEDDSDSGESSSDADEDASASTTTTGLHTPERLLRHCRDITGKKSIEEVMGALQAMSDSHKRTTKLAAKVARLEADAEADKVSALVASGIRAGKIAPSQKAWAKSQTPASLKAYLDASPKMVHGTDDEHTEARVDGVAHGAVSAEMARIWRKQGFTEAQFPALLEKMNATHKTNGAS
jgi:signal peptide peptidase SppA